MIDETKLSQIEKEIFDRVKKQCNKKAGSVLDGLYWKLELNTGRQYVNTPFYVKDEKGHFQRATRHGVYWRLREYLTGILTEKEFDKMLEKIVKDLIES